MVQYIEINYFYENPYRRPSTWSIYSAVRRSHWKDHLAQSSERRGDLGSMATLVVSIKRQPLWVHRKPL